LHARERFGPMDPALYLKRAQLRWRTPDADRVIRREGKLRPARIGKDCGSRCETVGPYLPFQLTRPHLMDEARPMRLPVSRGFYLEGANSQRPGQLVSDPPVPLFFEATRAADKTLRISYWAFFAFARPFRGNPRARGVEGDWERVTIVFDAKDKPALLRLPRAPREVKWSALTLRDGHPLLYATARTHELATTPLSIRDRSARTCVSRDGRRRCTLRVRSDDLLWRPWLLDGGVRDVSEEPWYGFGGAWGHASSESRTTGPLGPSPYVRKF
jgi:hypothetical protein